MAKKISRTRGQAVPKSPVRRRSRRTIHRKKRAASPLWISLRNLFIWAVILVACVLLVLYIFNYASGRSKPDTSSFFIEKSLATDPLAGDSPSEALSGDGLALEIPILQNGQREQIIEHEGYTVSYNSDYRIANWVAYELTGEEVRKNTVERSNKFVPDPDVEGATALQEDYSGTGYDRGHLAPAGDMKWSAKAMRESFYFSNICPQKPKLNQGLWKDLEELSRQWAVEQGSLYIVTGPVIEPDLKRLGKNRIGIPRQFYKVICTTRDKERSGIGFLFENRGYGKTSLQALAVPIDSVEKVTGIDFFPFLPDETEKQMEANVRLESWF